MKNHAALSAYNKFRNGMMGGGQPTPSETPRKRSVQKLESPKIDDSFDSNEANDVMVLGAFDKKGKPGQGSDKRGGSREKIEIGHQSEVKPNFDFSGAGKKPPLGGGKGSDKYLKEKSSPMNNNSMFDAKGNSDFGGGAGRLN